MFDTLIDRWQFVLRMFADPDAYLGVVLIALFVLLIVYILYLQSPQHTESAVARKLERKNVADIVSAALDQAVLKKKITAEVSRKYHKALGKALGLEDLVPRQRMVLPANIKKLKNRITKRLYAAGVDVSSAIVNLKVRRTSKKQKAKALLTTLKPAKS